MTLVSLSVAICPGYYHYIRYVNRSGPWVPIRERFDLAALPQRTVQYFIVDPTSAQLAAGDSSTGITSQIRLAADAWNQVETSEIRLAFGGVTSHLVSGATPSIEIAFDDLAPGVIAVAGPTTYSDAQFGPTGAFLPIQKSLMLLRRDLSTRPSFSEGFFLSVVHEFGHTLGLQHSFASGVMSTEPTRGTTKALPLAPDDVAGLSLLYPTRDFVSRTGTIAGRVLMGGAGVNLASVVAMSLSGSVVSTLTQPDGSYRMEGVPPGQYYVYAHPLPPAVSADQAPANLVLPKDALDRPFPVSSPFDLQFYPGTREPSFPVSVSAAGVVDNISFSVLRRDSVAIHTVQTFGYPGPVAVKPPFLSSGSDRNFIVASGVGLTNGRGPMPGLRAQVIGGSLALGPEGVRPYLNTTDFIRLDLLFSPVSGEGARHLLFSVNSDTHVLPAAFQVVRLGPPSVQSVVPTSGSASTRTAIVTGTNLFPDTRILVDGVPALVRSTEENNTRMFVELPEAPPGHRAVITALNSDGQSSLFLQNRDLPFVSFGASLPGIVSATPGLLSPGAEALVEIGGVNTNFRDGQVSVASGNPDIQVRRVWVLSPNRIWTNVAVSSAAAPNVTNLMVVSGLAEWTQPAGLQVFPAGGRSLSLNPQPVNAATGLTRVWPGATVTMQVVSSNGLSGLGQPTLLLNDQPVPSFASTFSQVSFQIPANTPSGPAKVRLQFPGESSPAVAIAVDTPPPVVTSVLAQSNTPLGSNRPALIGEQLTLLVVNLPSSPALLSSLRVTLGGVDLPVNALNLNPDGPATIQIQVPTGTPLGFQVPLIVSTTDASSLPYPLAVRLSL